MPTAKDQAICIRHWDWSETSQTVSLFTAQHGVIRGLAKGSRRENAPFSGGIELLTRGEAVFILKAAARDHGSLCTLTAWDLQEPRAPLRRSLPSLHAAMFLVDLVHHAVRDLDPHPALYEALDVSLALLTEGAGVLRVTAGFLWRLLDETGYRPDVVRDPRTGTVIAASPVYSFSPRLGGLVGTPAAPQGGGGKGAAAITAPDHAGGAALGKDEIWKVRPDTVDVLRRLSGEEETLDLRTFVVDTRVPDDAVFRSTALLASYFRFIHGAWPPSIRWVIPDHAQR